MCIIMDVGHLLHKCNIILYHKSISKSKGFADPIDDLAFSKSVGTRWRDVTAIR